MTISENTVWLETATFQPLEVDDSPWPDGDATDVISWFALHGGLRYAPVFGHGSFQVAYVGLIVGCLAYIIWTLTTCFGKVEEFADELHLPHMISCTAFLLPVAIVLACLRIILARQLLNSRPMNELFQQVLKGSEKVKDACGAPDFEGRNGDAANGRDEDGLDAAKAHVQWGMIKSIFPMASGYLFFLFFKYIFHEDLWVFFHLFGPWLLCSSLGMTGNHTVGFACEVSMARVDILCRELEELRERNVRLEEADLSEGYFTDKLKEYLRLDDTLMELCCLCGNVVLTVVAVSMTTAYCFLVTSLCFVESAVLHAGFVCCVGGCLYAAISAIWPLARLTDKCSSLSSPLYKPSLLMQVMRCGEMRLSPGQTRDYLKLMHIVKACPIGAKLPLLGLITTDDLMTYAKIASAVLPTVIAHSLTQVHGHPNQ